MTRPLMALIVLVLTGCAPSAQELLAGPNAVQHLAESRTSSRFDLVLPGRRAAFRVGSATPTFLSIYPGPEIKLFRLERGVEHDDRNLKVRVRAADALGTSRFEIPRDGVVELEASPEGDGLYRVTPIAPLPPGEYAFLSQVDLDRWQKYPGRVRIYAFGVD
jgi:hypothetical protein